MASFVDRCDQTYRIGPNRQQRRDTARATQKKGAPRGPAPVHPAVLAMAMRLRENALVGASGVQDPASSVVVSSDGGDPTERGDHEGDGDLPGLSRSRGLRRLRRGNPRNLGGLGRTSL